MPLVDLAAASTATETIETISEPVELVPISSEPGPDQDQAPTEPAIEVDLLTSAETEFEPKGRIEPRLVPQSVPTEPQPKAEFEPKGLMEPMVPESVPTEAEAEFEPKGLIEPMLVPQSVPTEPQPEAEFEPKGLMEPVVPESVPTEAEAEFEESSSLIKLEEEPRILDRLETNEQSFSSEVVPLPQEPNQTEGEGGAQPPLDLPSTPPPSLEDLPSLVPPSSETKPTTKAEDESSPLPPTSSPPSFSASSPPPTSPPPSMSHPPPASPPPPASSPPTSPPTASPPTTPPPSSSPPPPPISPPPTTEEDLALDQPTAGGEEQEKEETEMPSEDALITFEGEETTTDILNMLPEDQQSELQQMVEDTAQRLERIEMQTQAAQDAAPEGSEEVEYQYGAQGDEGEEENTEITVSESHPSVEDEMRELDQGLVQPPTIEVEQEVDQQPEDDQGMEDQLTGEVQTPQEEQIPDDSGGPEGEAVIEYRPADELLTHRGPQEGEEVSGDSHKSEGEAMKMEDQPTDEVQVPQEEEPHDESEREPMKIGDQPPDEMQPDWEQKNEQAPGDSGHESEGETMKTEEPVSPEFVDIDSTIA